MKIKEQIYEIVEKTKDKELYIYGMGVWGKRIRCLLQCAGRDIDGWLDSKKEYAINGDKVYSDQDIKLWDSGSYFIVISSAQSWIIKGIKEQLLQLGLIEEHDFYIFNKWMEKREGIIDINDYYFGYSRKYHENTGGYTGFKKFSDKNSTKVRKRIVVLGGSTSDCGYNTAVTNWTEWLEIILRESGCSVEVLAGGIQGYASSQELLKLIRDVLILRPDLVISFSGINDATGMGMLEGHPFIMKSVKYIVHDIDKVDFGVWDDREPSDIWFMNMKIMQSICSACNVAFLGILEPFPFYDSKNSKDEFARAFFDEDVQQRIFRFYDSVREKIKVENANILDLSNLLLNKQEVVYDYIHCDTKGNQLIAENIAKYIIQYL